MAKTQIDLLADYIMAEIPGEPSENEGAGDTAIRLLEQGKAALAQAELSCVACKEVIRQYEADLGVAEEENRKLRG